MADLARDLGLPVVIVARGALGTVNHTTLTLEAARSRELDIAGVVISHCDGELSAADEANLSLLRERLGELVIAEIPPVGPGETPDPGLFRLEPLVARLR